MEKSSQLTLENFLETFRNEAFLQSEDWRKFQEAEGHKTFHFENVLRSENQKILFCVWANMIEHKLSIVGKYFYSPRGPIIQRGTNNGSIEVADFEKSLNSLIQVAKENRAGWIRFDVQSEDDLVLIKKTAQRIFASKTSCLKKSPHDMQPAQILVIDIDESQEKLLGQMKSKTRYNIRLAQKKGVEICSDNGTEDERKKYLEVFLNLSSQTAERKKISFHEENHYRKMLEVFPKDVFKIYVAKYENEIIAANLMIFFGDTAIYLHGASADKYREVMAPFFLQWQQILDAKKKGCRFYDFGGVKIDKIESKKTNDFHVPHSTFCAQDSRQGITRFKVGFAPEVQPIVFSGSYDVVLNFKKYHIYRFLEKIRSWQTKIKKLHKNLCKR